MNQIIQYKDTFSLELKDVDKGGRVMVGAFTAYNNLDSDGDIARKGMFTKTWKENFGRIKHLLNHDVTKPVGKVQEFWEDDNHAFYKSKIGTHKLGNDVLDMAESGLLTEHSYGYMRTKENKTKGGNELLEVKQFEFSNLTGWGANENSPLLSFNKSLTTEQLTDRYTKRIKSLETFCRNTEASDDTIELLLLEVKQLQQELLNVTTQPVETAVEPEVKDDEMLMAIKQFNNLFN